MKRVLKELRQLNNSRDEKYALHNAISESLNLEKQYENQDYNLSSNHVIFVTELKFISRGLGENVLNELEKQIEILDSKIRKLLLSKD